MKNTRYLFPIFGIFAVAATAAFSYADCGTHKTQYERYLEDTVSGIDKMRGANGLVTDSAQVVPGDRSAPATLKILGADTGPTDIAVDLLVQAAIARRGGSAALKARENLKAIISTLEKVPFHSDAGKKTGLFYRLYKTGAIGVSAQGGARDLSSVDNVHLALALWTVSRDFRGRIGRAARRLFDRIDFSDFYDARTGFAYGNIHYDAAQTPNWQPERWNYSEIGSEARDVYTVGYALGLFRELRAQRDDARFVETAIKNIGASRYASEEGKILRVYDGGGFQLLLPEILVAESRYSVALEESAGAYAPMIIADGDKIGFSLPGDSGEFVPGAFSASQSGLKGDPRFQGVPGYNGSAGSPELVINQDYCKPEQQALWNVVSTPHASILAAAMSREAADELAPALEAMQSYASEEDHLYTPGIGWSDGIYVKDAGDVKRGQVVPVVLSLDQGMVALSILRMTDPRGLGPSAGALYDDPVTRSRLEWYFGLVDSKLETSPVGQGLQCGPVTSSLAPNRHA